MSTVIQGLRCCQTELVEDPQGRGGASMEMLGLENKMESSRNRRAKTRGREGRREGGGGERKETQRKLKTKHWMSF